MYTLNLKVSEELVLRQLDERDTAELYQLISSCRKHLQTWLKWIDTIGTERDVQQFIRMANQAASTYRGLQVGVRYRGELAGLISYDDPDWENRSVSIGAWLGDRFQGNGIMTKATWAMVDYAFRRLPFNRVEIRCGAGNEKSRAIPERLGFKKEGTIREAEWLHNRFIDHIVYGMTKKDYVQITGFQSHP